VDRTLSGGGGCEPIGDRRGMDAVKGTRLEMH